jgi:DHA1 family tetracycline resistance protein-like MFS transporter
VSDLSSRSARRRFLLLRGLRWLPTGLLMPVMVLLLLDRGFSLGQIGLIIAAQGFVVLLLELPTGALADSLGRRRMLFVASVPNRLGRAVHRR